MKKHRINIILFLATLITTTGAGALMAGINPFKDPLKAYYGLMFSIPLMSILIVHEMGHFVAAKKHFVSVTPPYFIPAPSLIGTFGAFIKIRSPLPDRNSLMDIGAAGPLSGIAVAIPVLVIGLLLSEIKKVDQLGGISLGTSMLFEFLAGRGDLIYEHLENRRSPDGRSGLCRRNPHRNRKHPCRQDQ